MRIQNILVPVDFTASTASAVQNALIVGDHYNTVIHLLHVTKAKHDTDAIRRLSWLEKEITNLSPFTHVSLHIIRHSCVQQGIIQSAREIRPDFIIIGKRHGHRWLSFLSDVNSSSLARQTGCAVLNVCPGVFLDNIRSVVLPIGEVYPARKIELLSVFSRKQKPVIHLLSLPDHHATQCSANVFIDTYRNLSQVQHCPIKYQVLSTTNPAKSILRYAVKINADLILVNPFNEAALSRFATTQISDLPQLEVSVLTAAACC